MPLIRTRAFSILHGRALKLEAGETHKELALWTDQWHLIKKRVMVKNDSDRVFQWWMNRSFSLLSAATMAGEDCSIDFELQTSVLYFDRGQW